MKNDPALAADTETPFFPMPREDPLCPAHRLREAQGEAPAMRVRIWNDAEPWVILRYDDCRRALADQRLSVVASNAGYPAANAGMKLVRSTAPSFVSMDDPEHAYYRKMMMPEFTFRKMEELRPTIERLVEALMDEMLAKPQPADLLHDFALALPTRIICLLLGVSYDDRGVFERYTSAIMDGRTTPEAVQGARVDLDDFLKRTIVQKRAQPGDDLLSRLVVDRLDKGEISEDALLAELTTLLVAGHDTTANVLALGVLALLRHPDQAAKLRASEDKDYIANAVEELLRFAHPGMTGRRRVALEDVDIDGQQIRKGEGVIVAHDVANWDPARFENPDRLDFDRDARGHIAFGFGIHQCLGQPLARVELQVAFKAILRRLPGLRLAVPVEELKFLADKVVYGVESLPIQWDN